MEKVPNISSEEELLQLRDEGKISETEYEELRQALRKTTNIPVEQSAQGELKPVKTSGLAIASLVLSLVIPIGCIPAIVCGHIALRKIEKDAMIRGRGLALAGLIIGYVALGFFIVPLMLYLSWEITPVAIEETELRSFPLDSTVGIKSQDAVAIDRQISSDGNGSIRIEARGGMLISMFDTGNLDVENARLIYRARLRTENVEGRVYISMTCFFPRGESYSSRALAMPLTGTTDWTTQETFFLLKKGEKPDNVSINLVIEGSDSGTVWIDDVRLLKGPPQ
jgi:hypothetical protein